MKRLSIILCLAQFLSLSSMHLALRQSARLSKIPKHKTLSFYSTPINKKTLFNHIASIGNIVATKATNYPLMLLPTASQQLHVITESAYERINEERNNCQATRDLDCFIRRNPHVIEDLEKMKKLNKEIEILKNDYKPAQQHIIDANLTFYAEDFRRNINKLEKQKKEYELSVIKTMSPFFRVYAVLEIPSLLRDNEKYRKQLGKLFTLSRISYVCSLPLAGLPSLFRDMIDTQYTNAFDAVITASAFSVCTLPYLALLIIPVDGMSLPAQLAYWTSILLSTKAAYNNTDASSGLREKIVEQHNNLINAIDILELQQTHLEKSKENNVRQ